MNVSIRNPLVAQASQQVTSLHCSSYYGRLCSFKDAARYWVSQDGKQIAGEDHFEAAKRVLEENRIPWTAITQVYQTMFSLGYVRVVETETRMLVEAALGACGEIGINQRCALYLRAYDTGKVLCREDGITAI